MSPIAAFGSQKNLKNFHPSDREDPGSGTFKCGLFGPWCVSSNGHVLFPLPPARKAIICLVKASSTKLASKSLCPKTPVDLLRPLPHLLLALQDTLGRASREGRNRGHTGMTRQQDGKGERGWEATRAEVARKSKQRCISYTTGKSRSCGCSSRVKLRLALCLPASHFTSRPNPLSISSNSLSGEFREEGDDEKIQIRQTLKHQPRGWPGARCPFSPFRRLALMLDHQVSGEGLMDLSGDTRPDGTSSSLSGRLPMRPKPRLSRAT